MAEVYEYNEGLGDFIGNVKSGLNRGADRFKRGFQQGVNGISDIELNQMLQLFLKFNAPDEIENAAKAKSPAPPAPPKAPVVPELDVDNPKAAQMGAEDNAATQAAITPPQEMPPEQLKKEQFVKGGHISYIMKKLGIAGQPNAKALSQALMALPLQDLLMVKAALKDQLRRMAASTTVLPSKRIEMLREALEFAADKGV